MRVLELVGVVARPLSIDPRRSANDGGDEISRLKGTLLGPNLLGFGGKAGGIMVDKSLLDPFKGVERPEFVCIFIGILDLK